jgi:site-specific recombinase XerC
MTRGRKRKHNPSIPAHIDQAAIPKGLYWDATGAGRWYAREVDATGKSKARTVAGPTARLSDLHAIVEARSGVDRKLLRSMLNAFHESAEFKLELRQSTRKDYGFCRDRVLEQQTKNGRTFGDLESNRITRPLIQRLIDRVAEGRKRDAGGTLVRTPSTAVHVLRYLRVAFRWGANRGWCEGNPALGVEPPKERKQRRLPGHDTFAALVTYARAHATIERGIKGSVAPYLADVAELAYLCRLRGIEIVVDLNDADVTDQGVVCRRRKGSLTNITKWDPRLRAVVDALQARRALIWAERKRPIPLRPEDRPLVVSVYGYPLSKSGFNSAWQRMVKAAIADGAIPEGARFGLHDLKRRGITDTKGTRGEKQQASGHREESMLDLYDFDVPLVDSAAASRAKGQP